jgi:hypothetical protein
VDQQRLGPSSALTFRSPERERDNLPPRDFGQSGPHEALQMKCPAELYTASTQPYRGIGEPLYPFHDQLQAR